MKLSDFSQISFDQIDIYKKYIYLKNAKIKLI